MKILQELKDLIPPLTPDEFATLEKSILAEGVRDRLVVWNDTLIDGHNRYEICQKHGIEFSVQELEFDNLDQVKVWMIDNQKGRRNLTDGWKWELAQKKKALLEEKGRELKVEKGKKARDKQLGVLSTMDKTPGHNTRKILSDELGWSETKIARANKVWKEADEETKEEVKRGDKSINQAYKEIKKSKKKAERLDYIKKQKEDIDNKKVKLPEGKFEVIVMDPPWNYGRKYDPDSSRVANPYPEMTQNELLKIKPPFADDSVLFLWTTHAFIWDAKELIDNWGLTYKATLVWDKEKIGMGAWFRMQCEFCLVAIKGKPYFHNTTYRDIIKESRREHSRKPNSFYEMVEEITAGRRLDYFSREKRSGWEVFGNESEKF